MPIEVNKHKDTFLSEAKNYISLMNQSLVELEKFPKQTQHFQSIFRAVHTLKSLSASMNYHYSETVCHAIEDLLVLNRENVIDYADLLFESFDYLSANLQLLTTGEIEVDPTELIHKIKSYLQTNQFITKNVKSTIAKDILPIQKIQTIDVKIDRIDTLVRLAEELLIKRMKLNVLREKIDNAELNKAVEKLGRLLTELQYHVMQLRLVKIDFIFDRFIRTIRDLAKQLGKKINLVTEGGNIELDRQLIDEIGESLSHLIRNAVDHGIESVKDRVKKGKTAEGTICLRAIRNKETVSIEVTDDGAGIDFVTLKNLAIKSEILSPEASNQEIHDVLFSQLSTSKTVTPLSGRGLGLSIVKQKIESVGGTIRVESIANERTSFFIEIPLTLAIIQALFVNVGSELYAIPIDLIERLVVVTRSDFKKVLNYEAILHDGVDIPILRLGSIFNCKANVDYTRNPVVIIGKGTKRVGLVVDTLIATQEVVVKPISRIIKNSKFFSGAALIGSGQMILILDTSYLLHSMSEILGVNFYDQESIHVNNHGGKQNAIF